MFFRISFLKLMNYGTELQSLRTKNYSTKRNLNPQRWVLKCIRILFPEPSTTTTLTLRGTLLLAWTNSANSSLGSGTQQLNQLPSFVAYVMLLYLHTKGPGSQSDWAAASSLPFSWEKGIIHDAELLKGLLMVLLIRLRILLLSFTSQSVLFLSSLVVFTDSC